MAKFRLESPHIQDEAGTWLRGNLHVHTTRSDGKGEPLEKIRK